MNLRMARRTSAHGGGGLGLGFLVLSAIGVGAIYSGGTVACGGGKGRQRGQESRSDSARLGVESVADSACTRWERKERGKGMTRRAHSSASE